MKATIRMSGKLIQGGEGVKEDDREGVWAKGSVDIPIDMEGV